MKNKSLELEAVVVLFLLYSLLPLIHFAFFWFFQMWNMTIFSPASLAVGIVVVIIYFFAGITFMDSTSTYRVTVNKDGTINSYTVKQILIGAGIIFIFGTVFPILPLAAFIEIIGKIIKRSSLKTCPRSNGLDFMFLFTYNY